MKTKRNPSDRGQQTIAVDPATIWDLSKSILFAVARRVRQSVRLKLEGHGRGEAEPEELVNDAFVCLMEALPRFDPATARLTTFVYGLAFRRMWLVARAAFYGLSPEQMHRLDATKRAPRYHSDVDDRRNGFRQLEADGDERQSVRKVDAIRQSLPLKDRALVDLWLEESGNATAAARRLGRNEGSVRDRYRRLFRRIRTAAV